MIAGGILCRNQWHSLAAHSLRCGPAPARRRLRPGGHGQPGPEPDAVSQTIREQPLVQTGIYGLIRHPLYTAVFCGSVGWALVWQSWPALLAALALAPLFDAKARREERWLRQKFPEYAGYERQVRRFVPWIY